MAPPYEPRPAQTRERGREIPEAEVVRAVPEAGRSFQVRPATTVTRGRRRRAEEESPGQTFQSREAGTVTLRPPHWSAPKVTAPPEIPEIKEEETHVLCPAADADRRQD